MSHLTKKRWLIINAILVALAILTVLTAIHIGEAPSEPRIIFYSRLPRILLGLLVGLALGSGGTAFQALLRNPLADPYILGVSGGAALGGTIGLSLGLPFLFVSLMAFVAAVLVMLFIYWVARFHGRLPAHTLLLTGVIFNAFAFSLIMLIHSLVTMEQAHEILFTLIGNLEVYDYSTIGIVAVFVIIGFITMMVSARKMNLLSLGDETAEHLGVDIASLRKIIFFAASLMIGAVVSVSGLVGFVGLFIPHAVRLVVGSDHRIVVPASGLTGAIFLVWSDVLARNILMHGPYQTQLPVGVITALIGGPVFVWLLRKGVR